MRFNVTRILNGLNGVRKAGQNIYRKLSAKPAETKSTKTKQPKPPPLPGTVPPKPPKAASAKVISPKKLSPGVRAKQKQFKGGLRRQVAANPQMGGNGKPLNKQQRTQGAAAKMAAWKQKRKVSP